MGHLARAACARPGEDGVALPASGWALLSEHEAGAGLATGRLDDRAVEPRSQAARLARIQEAGARCFAIACTRAVVLARSHAGGPPSYRDLCPSAWA